MTRRYCSTCRQTFSVAVVCPVDEMPLLDMPTQYPEVGQWLDDATVLTDIIADGGMSRVFSAQRTDQESPVAVKVLDPTFGSDEPAVERYYREARMNLLLVHPNVVDVAAYGLSKGGHHTITMELLEGKSLAQALKDEAWLPWKRAVHIAVELADALGHAHSRRVIHRDIKPDNVQLIGEPGAGEQVKLLDFGVAYYAADNQFSGPAPGSTGVSGTPAYMSPEQIQGLAIDGRSDLYGLGTLLFEMLAGRLPFDGKDPVTMCRDQLYTKPPALSEMLPVDSDVPPALTGIVDQLLRKRRPQRLSGVGALLDELLRILPRADWPTRLMQPPPKREPAAKGTPKLSVHGLPRRDLLDGRDEASVALLHVEVIEGDEQLLFPTTPAPGLIDVLQTWCKDIAEEGARVQRPDVRSVRCFFGMYELEGDPEGKALQAAKWAGVLRDRVAACSGGAEPSAPPEGDGSDTEPDGPWLFRAGLVARHFKRDEVEGPAVLQDNDADEAYWLAREAEPGDLMAETDAAFALREVSDIEPTGDLVVPPDGRLVRCWRVTPPV